MLKKYFLFLSFTFVYLCAVEVLWQEKEIAEENLPKIYKQYISNTYAKEIKSYEKHLKENKKVIKEEEAWIRIQNSIDIKKIKTYIQTYPNSKYITQANQILKEYKVIIHNGLEYSMVKSPYTKRIWLDRNLGATQACITYNDKLCYGDYFQWGRNSDGHEKKNSFTIHKIASSIKPNHGKFIASNVRYNWDWLKRKNNNLWQGVNGINNPCPSGFKVPSKIELKNEIGQVFNNQDAFDIFLKIPSASYRYNEDGSIGNRGNMGYLWTSSIKNLYFMGKTAWAFTFNKSKTDWNSSNRAKGSPIRCIKQ